MTPLLGILRCKLNAVITYKLPEHMYSYKTTICKYYVTADIVIVVTHIVEFGILVEGQGVVRDLSVHIPRVPDPSLMCH